MLISKNLQYLRRVRGFKQKDFLQLGIKTTTYNNWERGVTQPDAATLNQLSQFLEVSVDDLMNRDLEADPIRGVALESEIEKLQRQNDFLLEKVGWLEDKAKLLEEVVQIYRDQRKAGEKLQ